MTYRFEPGPTLAPDEIARRAAESFEREDDHDARPLVIYLAAAIAGYCAGLTMIAGAALGRWIGWW